MQRSECRARLRCILGGGKNGARFAPFPWHIQSASGLDFGRWSQVVLDSQFDSHVRFLGFPVSLTQHATTEIITCDESLFDIKSFCEY
jgi:hypothetical protein